MLVTAIIHKREAKMRFSSLLASSALLALIVSTSTADAAIIYTTRAAFNAATTAPGIDTFAGLSTTGSTPSPLNRTAGAYSYTASASAFFGAGSAANPSLSTNLQTDTITFFNFAPSISALAGISLGLISAALCHQGTSH
jgi:hypothetical protein